MSSDKRRRARVQGGWAPPANQKTAVRSDRDKPKIAPSPAWLGKNVDTPVSTPRFVYEEPSAKEVAQKPSDIVYTKPGVYDISTEPSGVSRIRYFPNFLDPQEASELYEQFFHEVPWRQRSDSRQGVSYLQPRLTAWFGDLSYSYSGVTHQPNDKWPEGLRMLQHRLEEVTGVRFNSLLANLYRDNHDSIDWHSDDEPSLRDEPIIASLSFGDPRNFELRKKPPKESMGDYSLSQVVRVPLTNGSLLIMEGATQADWQHRVPKEYHDRGPRINLTYRVIFPV